ncbi:MAG: hypothetical protein OCC49_10290 [Fibrobacterales bacterium]
MDLLFKTFGVITVILGLVSCGIIGAEPEPTQKDYYGTWIATWVNDTKYDENRVDDVIVIDSNSIAFYHPRETDDESMIYRYGSPYLQKVTFNISWYDNYFSTASLIERFNFRLKGGTLEQDQFLGRQDARYIKYDGEFPRESWAWPAQWVISK